MQIIPQELQNWPYWTCYRKDGKHKVPYYPLLGEPREPSPRFGVPFDMALRHLEQPSRVKYQYDGIGCILGHDPHSGLVLAGLDIDNCCSDQGIDQDVLEKVCSLASYTEYSPSGHGLHVYCWIETREQIREKVILRGMRHEFYTVNYMTVTGLALPSSPETVENRTEAFLDLRRSLVPGHAGGRASAPLSSLTHDESDPLYASDKDLLQAALNSDRMDSERGVRHGTLLRARLDGDSRYDDYDRSQSDFSALLTLAWWSRRNPQQMEDIFLAHKCAERWSEKRSNWSEYQKWLRHDIGLAIAKCRTVRQYPIMGGQGALRCATRPLASR